jgi:predicted N-acyltransferase
MSQAVARFLERERAGVSASIDELNEHRAFKAGEVPLSRQ